MWRNVGRAFAFAFLWVFLAMGISHPVYADAAPGDVVVAVGANLTPEQREQVLRTFGVQDISQDKLVVVTNAEEYALLGKYLPKAVIGTRAISSVKVTLLEPGKGLHVRTEGITYLTPEQYQSAAATAGVKDAEIYVYAPIPVSGTAALTGIVKAFEGLEGKTLDPTAKDVAAEEFSTNYLLSEKIGKEQATALIQRLKEEIASGKLRDPKEIQDAIDRAARELGVTLSPEDRARLEELVRHLREANIDWGALARETSKIKQEVEKFLQDPATQSFLQKVWSFLQELFHRVWEWLQQVFGGGSGS